MTRDEARSRILSFEADPSFQPEASEVEDALKLVEMLPDRALERMSESWIRLTSTEPKRIEFFWSRAFKVNNPGNRITSITTRGNGRFSVNLRKTSGDFDVKDWQRAANGDPAIGELSLTDEGAQHLVDGLAKWQVGESLEDKQGG